MGRRTQYCSDISGHALVFGGTGGIGLAVLDALVANGVRKVSFTYGRSEEKAREIADR